MIPKIVQFVIPKSERYPNEVLKFLSSIRSDGVLHTAFAEVNSKALLEIVYVNSTPLVTGVAPVDGSVAVPSGAGQRCSFTFDEELGSVTTSHVVVYANGSSPGTAHTIEVSASKYTLSIAASFDASGVFYQIILLNTLPFLSGRVLGQDVITSFTTA